MSKYEASEIKPGLYKIFWESGGSSLAAIGIKVNGDKWIAPINWTFPSGDPKIWEVIKKIKRLA